MVDTFLNDHVELHCGDCLAVLATLPDNSIDACVTDPPYQIGFMGKRWDGGDIASRPETWAAVCRVLKPGAHLLAFGGTRTAHRMACAIEDAGFEIRDTICWLYGSGFPKSHSVSKAIDATLITGKSSYSAIADVEDSKQANLGKSDESFISYGSAESRQGKLRHGARRTKTEEITDAARQWQGWGTALKPAMEPIVLARKPLSEGTVAANVLEHGTGAINVDGCRIEAQDQAMLDAAVKRMTDNAANAGAFQNSARIKPNSALGRWPANVVHDGSDEVVGAFPDTGPSPTTYVRKADGKSTGTSLGGNIGESAGEESLNFGDSGSAARFFYTAKAGTDDRAGSKHPTVKPLDLMAYLVRLVTPKGGTVLDPFAGTGTTGEAAWREGMRAVLIEAEPDYQADIRRRMALAVAGPDERTRESIKARGLTESIDTLPLFARDL